MTAGFAGQTLAVVRDIRERYGWRIPALVALMAAVALAEGVAMALLLPLLTALGVSAGSTGDGSGAWIGDGLARLGLAGSPYAVTGLLLLFLAAQLLLFVAQQWWVSWLQRDYGAHWQRRLFDAFIHADWGFFTSHKLGGLTNLIAQETFRLSGTFFILAQAAATAIAGGVYLAIAFAISWQVTALMLALGVILAVGVRGLGRRNYRIGLRLGPLASELNVLLTEFFGGAKLIKATATEELAVARVGRVVDEMRVQHAWATFLPSLVRAIIEFAAMAALCLLLVFGYRVLAIPTGSVLVVLALFLRLLPRFNAMQQSVQNLATYVPAFDEARRMLLVAERASERPRRDLAARARPPAGGALRIAIERGGYGPITTIRDIHLTLPERGLIGVVGESGAGKSTLVNCVLGLADVQAGRISFGDVEMTDVPLTLWRRQIGYVPQDTVLFHLSIRDNLAWAAPDATDAQVMDAARQALAHDFILQQPQGYATVVGDQGLRLSGGQRQRLAIARALLGQPRLLLMDEATNALDTASEAAVMEMVDRLRQRMCVVMVAHRLQALRGADLIVVLENGRVAETGTWNELVNRRGALARLAAAL